jgi:glycosyltransferase involved in cell wall biosynthesis
MGICGSFYSIYQLCLGLRRRGHRVFLGINKDSELRKIGDVQIFFHQIKNRFDIKEAKKLTQFVKNEAIQIVNTQLSLDGYTAILAKRLYGMRAKVILNRRTMPLSQGGPIQGLFYLMGADKIVAVSKAVKTSLIKRGIPPYIISVVHNGISEERKRIVNENEIEKLKNKFDIKKNDKIIGVISRRKKQEEVIGALKFLPEDIKVLFIGIEKDFSLSHLVKNLGIKNQIYYTGFQKDVAPYYKIISLNIVPSVTEGLSQTILESLLYEVPVVATNAGGNPEIIRDGENGFLYKYKNTKELAAKIKILFEDRELRNSIIANGKRTVREDFNMENTVSGIEKIYFSLLQN